MSYFTDALDPKQFDDLVERFFVGNPVRAIKTIEGQGLDGDIIVLGTLAGPLYHISHLTHEMCHLAELSVKRVVSRPHSSWGFKFGKYWEVLGRSGYEAQTDQSVHREMRAWAYQWSLHQALGLPIDEEESTVRQLVSSVKYMDAFFIYRNKVLTPEQVKEYGYRGSEEKAIDIMADEVLRLSQTEFTYERFCLEWDVRMSALKS